MGGRLHFDRSHIDRLLEKDKQWRLANPPKPPKVRFRSSFRFQEGQTVRCGNCHQDLPVSKFDRQKAFNNLYNAGTQWCRKCVRDLPKRALSRAIAKREQKLDKNPRLPAEWGTRKINRWQKIVDRLKAQNVAHTAKRRTAEINATPPWVDVAAIVQVYVKAQQMTRETGVPYHVDHIVPLINKKVCGLHVPWNLQPIPAAENLAKSNKF